MKRNDSIKRAAFSFLTALSLAMTVVLSGCFLEFTSEAPTSEFLNLPLNVIYTNGIEAPFGISVNEFFALGFNEGVKKSWKKIDESTWSLLAAATDKVTGNETEFNIVLVKQSGPERVVLHRVLVNGQEANSFEKDTIANQFAYTVTEKKKK